MMKKLFPFFLVAIFGIFSVSCVSDDDGPVDYVDYDTYSRVIDLPNVNFDNINGYFQIERTFTDPLYSTDVVLVYMKTGTTTNNATIWQQIPITYYLSDGNEVDYNFDFSMYDVVLYASGTFDLTGTSYVTNKTFRIVLVPADPLKNAPVDYSDYNAVISYYDLDDSHPTQL